MTNKELRTLSKLDMLEVLAHQERENEMLRARIAELEEMLGLAVSGEADAEGEAVAADAEESGAAEENAEAAAADADEDAAAVNAEDEAAAANEDGENAVVIAESKSEAQGENPEVEAAAEGEKPDSVLTEDAGGRNARKSRRKRSILKWR